MNSRRNRRIKTLALAVSLLGLVCFIQEARAEKVLNGEVCQERVGKLTGDIAWLNDLESAKQMAKEKKKLIFWVNMLGKLEADT